jgi:CubicO group peptidase (beta-lactamase class C family)
MLRIRPPKHRRWLALAIVMLLLSAQAPAASQTHESVASEVDRLMATYDAPDRPGALVAVVRNGAIDFTRAYGMADVAHGVPVTGDTRMNIGSTAKQFTAFAVAMLNSEGRLSLDDDVRRHLPDLPDLGKPVTLRHLLTHTSGYREFLNALAIGGWRIEDADHISREKVLRIVQRQPALQNNPGAEWNYNNTGYALLAMVVETVTDQPFDEWLGEHLFRPLNMSATTIRSHPRQVVPGSARGYAPNGAGSFRYAPDVGAVPGPGSVYTTLGDLARWMGNLGSGEVGGADVLERVTTPYTLTSGDQTSYGLGLMIGRERGLRRFHHGGGDAGYTSHFAYYPDLDAGLILLVNRPGIQPGLTAALAALFFGEHMEPEQERPEAAAQADDESSAAGGGDSLEGLDPISFDAFAGRYEMEAQPGFVLSFWSDGDRLMSRGTGQPPFELKATSDSTFHLAAVGATVTFHRGPGGEVTGLTLHQNGNHAGRRLPDDDGPNLGAYAGRYYSEEFETYYTVAVEGNGLKVTHRRRDAVMLFHDDGDAFSGPFPLLQVTFDRDEDGRVSGLQASNVRARGIRFERVR